MPNLPQHVAIIMDGNGRWASARGLPRLEGHRRGSSNAKNIVKVAKELGIEYLTLWAFSTENWARPLDEIDGLIHILRIMLRNELAEMHKSGVKLVIIGEQDRLPKDVADLFEYAQNLTKDNTGITVVIAFSYGGRQDITKTLRKLANQVKSGDLDPSDIDCDLITGSLSTAGIPDPELVIRTSGEMRISNFMLWEMAYSEFVFSEVLWPDFGKDDLVAAIDEYSTRERRFGGITSKIGINR